MIFLRTPSSGAVAGQARFTARPCRGNVGGRSLSLCAQRQQSSAAASSNDGNVKHVSFVDMTYGNPLRLPRLPIPPLRETVTRYLKSLEPLTRKRPQELARATDTANKFLVEDGPLVHSMVTEADAKRKSYPYSYIEQLWDDMYLCGRWSLPVNSNPFLALQPPPKGTPSQLSSGGSSDPQIVGATRFISSFLKWSRRARDGTFEPDAPPGCLYGYALQAGTARIAKKARDELQFHAASRHAVVFCNNRVYRLNLLGIGEQEKSQIDESDLAKALEEIRASALTEPYGPSPGDAFVGHLTTKGRDEWATARTALEGFSSVNCATLFEIDSALLAIALDDHSTKDARSEARAFLTGDNGRNRWFDKHQLVVLKDGSMAVNFEHSYSDGMIWTRMLGEIWRDMYGVKANGVRPFPKPPLLSTPPPPPRELLWRLPQELKGEVQYARKEFTGTCDGYSLEVVDFRDFGKNSCKEWKVSPDAMVQMAIQLAFRRLHGEMAPTYESCATRAFHRGRTETIRSCTSGGERKITLQQSVGERRKYPGAPIYYTATQIILHNHYEAADFAELMGSESKGKDTLRSALDRAAARHVSVAKEAQQGHGVDRHMYAMRAAAAKVPAGDNGRLGAAFFEDPLQADSSHWRLSTSNLSVPFLTLFGFGPVVGNGYGLGYIVDSESIRMPVTSFSEGGHTDAAMMAKGVERALRDIGDVCR